MLSVNQVDDVLIEGEIIESTNEYVSLGIENVPIDNSNVKIENLQNENLIIHNMNVMIDHVKIKNA